MPGPTDVTLRSRAPGGGPGCATAGTPGYFSSDDTACCTASSRLVLPHY
jgi:hypothetical protein